MSDFKKKLDQAIDKIADLGGEVEIRCANCEIGKEECEKCDREFHQKAAKALIPIIEKGIVGEDKKYGGDLTFDERQKIKRANKFGNFVNGYNQRGREQRKKLKDLVDKG